MIDVSVSVDDQIELPSAVGEDAEVALDLVAQRIDHYCLAGALRHAEIGFAFAVIEFLEEHIANYSGVAAVAITAVRTGNEKRATSVLRTASSIMRGMSKRDSAASTASMRARVSGCAGTNRVQQSWSGRIEVSKVPRRRA